MAGKLGSEQASLYDQHKQDNGVPLEISAEINSHDKKKIALRVLDEVLQAAKDNAGEFMMGADSDADEETISRAKHLIEEYADAIDHQPHAEQWEQDANTRRARSHFDTNEHEYKVWAVNEALERGIDIVYPPYTNARYEVQTSLGTFGVHPTQESTRGNGKVELVGEHISKDKVVFDNVREHLAIHRGGDIAGSQFDGELFPDTETLIAFLHSVLPEHLQFDQHGMIELTLNITGSELSSIGYTGVKSVEELASLGVATVKGIRIPGGQRGEVDGVIGAWYPETERNSQTGAFETVLDDDGFVKNPHAKFEPEALLARTSDSDVLKTHKITIIIRHNPESGLAEVVTAYPGELAPPFPAKISSEKYSDDSLNDHTRKSFWDTHAFIKIN